MLLLCKTRAAGAMHVIYKKKLRPLKYYQQVYLVLLCKTRGEGAMHVIYKKNFDLRHYQNIFAFSSSVNGR